jgi:5-oxoprolinase (ATP-hydrolysing) subunit B
MRYLKAGGRGLLVEADTLEQVMGLHRSLNEDPAPGVVELVPGARTLLILFDPAATSAKQLADIAETRQQTAARPSPTHRQQVEIPVVYDGPDLIATARQTGLTTQEVIERHTGTCYTAAFGGFAPGFAYLTGLDPALWLPRRPVPRTQVAAGSVAIADHFAAVYPSSSPGGWHLLGHTRARLWDLDRPQPALLAPGCAVRFVQVKP